MSKTVSIESIVHLDVWHEPSILCQDILSWGIRIKKGDHIFRFTEVGKWLIDFHRPFIEEYANSKLPKSYRLHAKRNYIQGRIDDMVQLGLIKKTGIVKAEKNKSDTPVYQFTEFGVYCGWLSQAYKTQADVHSHAIEEIFSMLRSHLSRRSTSAARFVIRFLERCKEKGVFSDFIDRDVLPPMLDLDRDLGNLILFSSFSVNLLKYESTDVYTKTLTEMGYVFIETLVGLDEETQRSVLFQFKLDIESKSSVFLTNEWESMRYDNIREYKRLTLQGFCQRCGLYPFQIDTLEFLQLPFIFIRYTDTGKLAQKLDCKRCGKQDNLEIVPIWLPSTDPLVVDLPSEEIESIRTEWKQKLESRKP
jgi:hypothetical protein